MMVFHIYLSIYDELVQEYTEKYKEKKMKQMNIEYDYDTHNDSIIKSMSAAPKTESSA